MEFRILGPVGARRAGRPLPLTGEKPLTVLAALLLARGEVVSDDKLSRLLWGWDPPATMSAQLYTYVSRLRKLLGDDAAIERRAPGYALDIRDARFDLAEYERLNADGHEALRTGDVEKAGVLLRDALGLWSGPALGGVTEFLADAEGPRLAQARAVTLENRIQADLEAGFHQQLIAELTGLVAEFPLRERLRGQLMTALFRSGRQAEAQQLYHDGRAVLADELGVDPGADLSTLYLAMLDGSLGGRGKASAAPPADAPVLLPPDTADFTGRERELAFVTERLAPPGPGGWRPRRVLLTGMPGIGKTTLAVRAAHGVRRHFPDGQVYADLREPDGGARDPRAVLRTLLRVLGAPDPHDSDDLDDLVRRYRAAAAGKRLLLLLDNAASDAQLAPLLPNTPEAAVLITARTALASVTGAHTDLLDPLDDATALELLTAAAGPERLAAVPEAAAAIVAACAGLPLALRIAGTRIARRPHSAPRLLADRLTDPATRLRELRLGDLDVAERLHCYVAGLEPATAAALPRLARLAYSPLARRTPRRPQWPLQLVYGERPTGCEHNGAAVAVRTKRASAHHQQAPAHEPPAPAETRFTAASAAVALRVPEREAERVLDALADAALLEVHDAPGGPRYGFHPLVLLFAGAMADEDAVGSSPAA